MNTFLNIPNKRRLLSTAVILISVFTIYSNTFNASWHMDDTPNIVNNRPLHIRNLMPATLWQTFFAKPGHPGTFYRPIPCLTFALNWFVGQNSTTGYRRVNIFIHGLTAFIIYLLVLRLFQTPVLMGQAKILPIHNVALLCALLWSVHPLQTQAVTYIVQRMAQLAALFYLAAMLFYLKARLTSNARHRFAYFGGCGLYGVLGIMSKENAALLPLTLLLMEVCFFQSGRFKIKARYLIVASCGVVLITYVAGVYLFLNGNLLFFLNGYSTRPYTPLERLLTESRILWLYLSQIVLPLPARLSIEHDIVISTSLISPWSTLPAVLGIMTAIGAAMAGIRRYPVAAFAVLFFFLNHVVESSIIGLELIFEHRNYLPSVFLFLPVSIGILKLLTAAKAKDPSYSNLVRALVGVLVLTLGGGTYIRNQSWQTGETLWLDALKKAPNSARALNTLAIRLAWAPHATPGQRNKAIELFQLSIKGNKARLWMDADIYGNIANVLVLNGEYASAVPYYEKAVAADPNNLKVRADMITPLVRQGKFAQALKISTHIVEKAPHNLRYLNTTGFLLLWLDAPHKALPFLRDALGKAPYDPSVMLNLGAAMGMLQHYRQADWFFKRAIQLTPMDVWPFLFLVENQFKAGNRAVALDYLQRVIQRFSIEQVRLALQEPLGVHPPFSRQLIETELLNLGPTDDEITSGA